MSYQNLSELISSVQADLEQMEQEALTVQDLDRIQQNARELYERITVIKYQAIERLVKPEVEQPKELNEPTPHVEVKEEVEEERPTIRFDIKPSVEEPPKNQRNLLDEIQERVDEKTASFKDIEEPTVVLEQSSNSEAGLPKEEKVMEAHSTDAKSTSVNARFANEQTPSLADKLKRQPISNLMDAIGMNEKFLFMNDLFEGERDAFYNAVNHLNNLSNYIEADDYIQNSLVKKYQWDLEGSSALRFIELVERRYLA